MRSNNIIVCCGTLKHFTCARDSQGYWNSNQISAPIYLLFYFLIYFCWLCKVGYIKQQHFNALNESMFFWGWMDQWVRLSEPCQCRVSIIIFITAVRSSISSSSSITARRHSTCSETQHQRVSLSLDLQHSWNTGRIQAAPENQRTYTTFPAMVPLLLFLVVRIGASIPHPTSAGESTEHNSVFNMHLTITQNQVSNTQQNFQTTFGAFIHSCVYSNVLRYNSWGRW